MKKSALYLLVLSSFALPALASGLNENRDPAQTDVNTSSSVDQNTLQDDLLRKQKISTPKENNESQKMLQFTARELIENPGILEQLFVQALISPNPTILPTYLKLYEKVPTADTSLSDWANAILLRQTDLNQSVSAYRALSAKFPENNYIRFQLAETLFYNQEYEASKGQFERLRAAKEVTPQDVVVFDRYLDVINRKDDWNISFGASFLNDKNLANSAKQGTSATLPNGATVTYSTPRQSGQGISAWLSTDKKWAFKNGRYIAFDSSLSSKYYWDNKYYNDVNLYLGLGHGYSDARFNIQFTPYVQKRWYAGGVNSTQALKRYSNVFGASLSASYWLTQNTKYAFYYNFGYDQYDSKKNRALYDGASHALTNSIMYMPSSTQYWSLALDLTTKQARDKTNGYDRIGTRLTWGQEWPLGLSTSTTLGVAKRNYKEASFFGVKQKNTEYSASISLWHKEFHFAGFTPRITWSYSKVNSNIPIYAYDKNQVFFDVSKSF